MRRTLTAVVVAGAVLALLPAGALAKGPSTELAHGAMQGIVHARNARPKAQPKSPNLAYHGGSVMHDGALVTAIYWGSSWGSTSYQGDKVSGLATFYGAVGGSPYARTNIEYTDGTGHVSSSVTYQGTRFDGSSAPRRAPSVSAVMKVVAANIPNPVANGYYPVYSDRKRGGAQYCAWHSWGTVHGVLVQFAFFFDLTGDSGCNPGSDGTSRSQALVALANVSGHELSEALTDPHGDGWTDNSGYENSDKCAWVFDQPAQLNGSTWRIQGNWSNAAFNAGTGLPNRSGQKGCLYNS